MAHVITADGVKKSLKLKYGHAVYPDGVRKIKSGHAIDADADGAKLARKFYTADQLTYTGTFTVSQVTGTDGVLYKLYRLTKSGTLTLNEDAQAWVCGGGGSAVGIDASGSVDHPTGGGGGGYVKSGNLSAGVYTVTIGSASGATKIGSVLTANGGESSTGASGGKGGSGGGSGTTSMSTNRSGGSGAGVSTYPFGITSLKAHCAGGGGGTYCYGGTNNTYYGVKGGQGGTNGGNGGNSTIVSSSNSQSSYLTGGTGGSYGGGRGGQQSTGNGVNASFYGSGGGGAGRGYYHLNGTKTWYGAAYYGNGIGGKGYQGVAYILIPA